MQSTTFGPLQVAYDDTVLEPRAWTQLQSFWAAELLDDLPAGDVLELCAGVGHIGLLAVRGSGRRLVQVDVNPAACVLARANAEAAGMVDSVEVRQGDLTSALDESERFALVVADPPYIPTAQVGGFAEDPGVAIDGGLDGMDLVRTCLEVAARHLLDGGAVLLQVRDAAQVEATAALLAEPDAPSLSLRGHRLHDRGAVALLTAADAA